MKETLHALHFADVEAFFAALSLLPQLAAGEMRCEICGDPVGTTNFGAALRRQSRLLLACGKAECTLTLAGLDKEER
jgi:hypothetical protein